MTRPHSNDLRARGTRPSRRRADPLGGGTVWCQRVLGAEVGGALPGDRQRRAGPDRRPPSVAPGAASRASARAGGGDATRRASYPRKPHGLALDPDCFRFGLTQSACSCHPLPSLKRGQPSAGRHRFGDPDAAPAFAGAAAGRAHAAPDATYHDCYRSRHGRLRMKAVRAGAAGTVLRWPAIPRSVDTGSSDQNEHRTISDRQPTRCGVESADGHHHRCSRRSRQGRHLRRRGFGNHAAT